MNANGGLISGLGDGSTTNSGANTNSLPETSEVEMSLFIPDTISISATLRLVRKRE